MSNFKITHADWAPTTVEENRALGANLLNGKLPVITPLGDEKIIVELERTYGEYLTDYLTNDDTLEQHIDFWGEPFSLTYDLGKVTPAEKLVICGFGAGTGEYLLDHFEVYASDEEKDLYEEQNRIYIMRRDSKDKPENLGWSYDSHGSYGWVFDAEGSLRFLGIKLLSSCPSDEITRIARVALMSDYNTQKERFSELHSALSCLKGVVPKISGEYDGDPSYITGEKAYGEGIISAKTPLKLSFEGENTLYLGKMILLGAVLENAAFTLDGRTLTAQIEAKPAYDGLSVYTVDFGGEQQGSVLTVEIPANAKLDKIVSDTTVRAGSVEIKNVVQKDFIGAGCDVFPTAFSEYGKREGYNEVYWELEKHHIQKAKPHAVRLWFQIDWVVETREQYESGDWQFDNPNMESVLKYCEAFRDEGVEVELNFGWKVGKKVQDWFAIGGLDGKYLECAAPADLKNYGKACAATLEYLIIEKGMDNVKYLTFYNEPTYLNGNVGYDFACHGDAAVYWLGMLRYAYYYIQNSRVKDRVEIWACEESGTHTKWMEAANILAPECFTRHSIHRYSLSYEAICKWYDNEIMPFSDGKPVILTEFGNSSRSVISWEKNHINNILAGAERGVCGAFIWVMAGAPLVDPLNWMHASGKRGCADRSYEHWDFLPHCETLNEVGESLYEFNLLTHYVPNHSDVCHAFSTYKNGDVRLNAFKYQGDVTVCVESRGEKENRLELTLDVAIDRPVYKYVYTRRKTGEANLIVPMGEVFELKDGNRISDTLPNEYALVVYSTIKPIRQVLMDEVDLRVKAGSEVKIGTTVLGTELKPALSISKSLMPGAELCGDTVKVPATAKPGEMLSVKAELETGEYGIALVRVEE